MKPKKQMKGTLAALKVRSQPCAIEARGACEIVTTLSPKIYYKYK
jgi:hypothetical protein